jgi:hypothetical protein
VVFTLAEILRLKKFREANHLNAAPSSVGDALEGLGKILLGLRSARHLDERDAKFFWRQACETSKIKYSRSGWQRSAVTHQRNHSCRI